MEFTDYERGDVHIDEWDPTTRDVFEFVSALPDPPPPEYLSDGK